MPARETGHKVNPSEAPPDEEAMPTFSEQIASQLGGVGGMIESSIPALAFVVVNIIWSLTPALIVAVALGLGIAGYRLLRNQSVRHAMNGLFGIGIGAALALKTGDLPFELQVADIDRADQSAHLLDRALSTFERNFIIRALERSRWNVTQTSRYLGIPLSTLKFKLDRLEIKDIARKIRGSA